MLDIATRNVLLVEDNPGDVTLIRQCLDEFISIELFHVPNAVQANRYLHRKPPFDEVREPDLILLDLRLPIFDGMSVLQGIRENKGFDHVPVVVLTSSTLQTDRVLCTQLGATDYVLKPVEWNNWRSTIRQIFRRHLHVWE